MASVTIDEAALIGLTVETQVVEINVPNSLTIGGGGGTSSGNLTASIVLYCPDRNSGNLTPAVDETMYWVFYQQGHVGAGDGGAQLNDWYTLTSFDWTGSWAADNDPTNVLILLPEEQWPTVLAEVTLTGFTAIDVLGGQQVTVGCGGAGFGSHAVWIGSNGDSDFAGSIDPTTPATSFRPSGVDGSFVEVGTDDTGFMSLRSWIQNVYSVGAGPTYYDDSIAVQPWVQTDADFGVSATVTAHGYVTRTETWLADATITFASYVDVTTPGTGAPQFFIREMIRSFSADFAGWYWGWNSPSDLRCEVHGQIGGFPFTGFVNRSGNILDANGDTVSRVLVTGDYLTGTVTGVFQND
jgi:hypothetical protein